MGFPSGNSDKESACKCGGCKRHRFEPWVGKIPWRRAWQPNPVFLSGGFHGQAMVFPLIVYGCKSRTLKKAECQRIMPLNCGAGEDS